jgi:hypothetical protein
MSLPTAIPPELMSAQVYPLIQCYPTHLYVYATRPKISSSETGCKVETVAPNYSGECRSTLVVVPNQMDRPHGMLSSLLKIGAFESLVFLSSQHGLMLIIQVPMGMPETEASPWMVTPQPNSWVWPRSRV